MAERPPEKEDEELKEEVEEAGKVTLFSLSHQIYLEAEKREFKTRFKALLIQMAKVEDPRYKDAFEFLIAAQVRLDKIARLFEKVANETGKLDFKDLVEGAIKAVSEPNSFDFYEAEIGPLKEHLETLKTIQMSESVRQMIDFNQQFLQMLKTVSKEAGGEVRAQRELPSFFQLISTFRGMDSETGIAFKLLAEKKSFINLFLKLHQSDNTVNFYNFPEKILEANDKVIKENLKKTEKTETLDEETIKILSGFKIKSQNILPHVPYFKLYNMAKKEFTKERYVKGFKLVSKELEGKGKVRVAASAVAPALAYSPLRNKIKQDKKINDLLQELLKETPPRKTNDVAAILNKMAALKGIDDDCKKGLLLISKKQLVLEHLLKLCAPERQLNFHNLVEKLLKENEMSAKSGQRTFDEETLSALRTIQTSQTPKFEDYTSDEQYPALLRAAFMIMGTHKASMKTSNIIPHTIKDEQDLNFAKLYLEQLKGLPKKEDGRLDFTKIQFNVPRIKPTEIEEVIKDYIISLEKEIEAYQHKPLRTAREIEKKLKVAQKELEKALGKKVKKPGTKEHEILMSILICYERLNTFRDQFMKYKVYGFTDSSDLAGCISNMHSAFRAVGENQNDDVIEGLQSAFLKVNNYMKDNPELRSLSEPLVKKMDELTNWHRDLNNNLFDKFLNALYASSNTQMGRAKNEADKENHYEAAEHYRNAIIAQEKFEDQIMYMTATLSKEEINARREKLIDFNKEAYSKLLEEYKATLVLIEKSKEPEVIKKKKLLDFCLSFAQTMKLLDKQLEYREEYTDTYNSFSKFMIDAKRGALKLVTSQEIKEKLESAFQKAEYILNPKIKEKTLKLEERVWRSVIENFTKMGEEYAKLDKDNRAEIRDIFRIFRTACYKRRGELTNENIMEIKVALKGFLAVVSGTELSDEQKELFKSHAKIIAECACFDIEPLQAKLSELSAIEKLGPTPDSIAKLNQLLKDTQFSENEVLRNFLDKTFELSKLQETIVSEMVLQYKSLTAKMSNEIDSGKFNSDSYEKTLERAQELQRMLKSNFEEISGKIGEDRLRGFPAKRDEIDSTLSQFESRLNEEYRQYQLLKTFNEKVVFKEMAPPQRAARRKDINFVDKLIKLLNQESNILPKNVGSILRGGVNFINDKLLSQKSKTSVGIDKFLHCLNSVALIKPPGMEFPEDERLFISFVLKHQEQFKLWVKNKQIPSYVETLFRPELGLEQMMATEESIGQARSGGVTKRSQMTPFLEAPSLRSKDLVFSYPPKPQPVLPAKTPTPSTVTPVPKGKDPSSSKTSP